MQSMFFSMVLVQWFGVDLGVMLVFHVLVAVSRVYFMCHWIGDTVAATVLTYPLGVIFTMMRDSQDLHKVFDKLFRTVSA